MTIADDMQKQLRKTQERFKLHTDPGHGWLQVPHKLLVTLLIAHKISSYSYMGRHYAYLEEDCDLALFVEAYERYYGFKPNIYERYSEDTYVRGLKRFNWHELYKELGCKTAYPTYGIVRTYTEEPNEY